MGVGKSTLTKKLGDMLGWDIYLEPAASNPYLDLFYKDMKRWSFHSQIFFLTNRLAEHIDLARASGTVIQDRSVYENAEIFAKNLYENGLISEKDWRTYNNLYQNLLQLLPPPNLVVYLKAHTPTLMKRISKRGRDYERRVTKKYIRSLNRLYNSWAGNFTQAPLLTINTDRINFVEDEKACQSLAQNIITRLPHRRLPLYKSHNRRFL